MAVSSVVRHLLEVERGQLGTHESPRNSNNVKYNTAFYGHPVHNIGQTNYAWCVVFQWWCFQHAGIPTSIFPKSANVFAVRDWFKKKHRFDHTPKVGSLVIFSFSHIGLVEKVLSGGRIQTIEGNTDAAGGRTGGKVMRKVRSSGILGYCHPDYDKVKHVAPVDKPFTPVSQGKIAPIRGSRPIPQPLAAVKPKDSSAAVGHAGAHTALSAQNVTIPAGKFTRISFSTATANTAKFWVPGHDGSGGYNLGTGPGLFVADVTVRAPALPDGAELRYRLVQADPAHDYATSREHSESSLVLGSAPAGDHACTASHLGAKQHLWLEVFCTEAVTLPELSAEVVMLSGS